jgi:RimJ/RimL family protein N-acetyltransferase
MPTVPVLETDRLVLRGFRSDDLDAITEMWAMPEIVRYIGGVPMTREQSWTRLLRQIGMWSVMGFGFWVITEKATGRVIGEAGFHEMRRALPEFQGKGYATEALNAMWAWIGANRPDMTITCIIDPRNAASIGLAERHGFREFARSPYQGSEVVLLRRNAS